MNYGYTGKIIHVDLSDRSLVEESLDDGFNQLFLGGHGVGVRIIFSRQRAKVDPLGPENTIGFLTGPLTGTPALIGSRYTVVAKSPLTGTWGEANSGGYFGPYLKFSGYDGVFVTGIAERPTYIFIDNGDVFLKDATHIWGKDTNETEDILQRELGRDTRIVCIGPSGERLSLISAVINDRARAAARSGLGAVMGSKRLKAIAVKGDKEVSISDPHEVLALRKHYLGKLGRMAETLREYGTCIGVAPNVKSGDAPVKNWGGTVDDFPNGDLISGEVVTNLQQKRYGCWRCPIACGGLMKAGKTFKYRAGAHKPEYESLASFGSLCLNDDIESLIKLNDICSRYGLDTISAGAAIAFAIECYENGIITSADLEGIELTWGNARAIVAMTIKLAKREGFGDVLADGVKVASERIRGFSSQFAMHVQGEELPMHDPKKTPGWATSYIVDAAPGRHTPGNEDNVLRILGMDAKKFDWKDYRGRGLAHKIGADWFHAFSAAGVCMFGSMSLPAQALPDFLNSVTGWKLDIDGLLEIGERIANLRQAFNIREGLNPTQLCLPDRIIGEPPLRSGPLAGIILDPKAMANEYYDARDWNRSTGKPSRKKLKELGLVDMADSIDA
ncbi:aldehyde ferredoxin oxidoreductase family protein [Chloroflexota bacterium]